jgi:hypothetical protein
MRKLPATIAASTAQPHPGVLRSPGIGKCWQKSLTGTFFPPCWSPAGASTGPLDGGHMEAFVRGVSRRSPVRSRWRHPRAPEIGDGRPACFADRVLPYGGTSAPCPGLLVPSLLGLVAASAMERFSDCLYRLWPGARVQHRTGWGRCSGGHAPGRGDERRSPQRSSARSSLASSSRR